MGVSVQREPYPYPNKYVYIYIHIHYIYIYIYGTAQGGPTLYLNRRAQVRHLILEKFQEVGQGVG